MLNKIAILASGAAAAQVFTLSISPLLTRLYTPDEFGSLGAVLSLSGIFAVAVHGRYNLAISIPRSDRQANVLFLLASIFTFCASVFCGLVLALCGAFGLLKAPSPLLFAFSVAILTLFNAQLDVFSYWQGRNKKYAYTAKISVLRSFATGLSQIALAFGHFSGLIIGALFGPGCAVMIAARSHSSSFSRPEKLQLKLIALARRYKSFPLYSMPQGLLASFGLNSAPLIFGMYFGSAAVGQYWLAYRILVAPIALVGGAYRQVVLTSFSGGDNKFVSHRKSALKHTAVLASIGIAVSCVVILFGEPVFSYVFGKSWSLAGVVAGWLSVAFMADLAKIPATTLIHYLGVHKNFLKFELILSLSRVSVLALSSLYLSFIDAVMVFSITGLCGSIYIVKWSFSLKESRL